MPGLNLCIDTNIFLNFYNFKSETFEKLNNIYDLINRNEIILFIPDQVKYEFEKNREVSLSKTLVYIKSLKKTIKPLGAKSHQGFNEIENINNNISEIIRISNNLEKKLRSRGENYSLPADKLIIKLFEISKITDISEFIICNAKKRYDRGFPPGKKRSYGDAIIWESLLYHIRKETDLYFITNDKDFQSPLNNKKLLPFLIKEWNNTKESEIYYYNSITSFLQDKFPVLNITDKEIKEENISLEQNYNLLLLESLPISDIGLYSISSTSSATVQNKFHKSL